MDDQNLKNSANRLLRDHGFSVTEIAKSEGIKTPDFHAKKDGADFIIELKSREDDKERLEAARRTFAAGKVASKIATTNRTNTISGIVEEAVDQLQGFQAPSGAFKVVWLHAAGSDPELQFMQFRGSLYGLCDIADMGEEKDNTRPCYYFDFNDFFRHSVVLHGAILTTTSELQICINTFSPHVEQFRHSPLVDSFRDGIDDPAELERRGIAYVADCDYDRRDKQRILAYLQTKYGKKGLVDFNLKQITASILVPRLK